MRENINHQHQKVENGHMTKRMEDQHSPNYSWIPSVGFGYTFSLLFEAIVRFGLFSC